MSSNDSMGIVFKCLSKGAVDFLVKPIRKNELKNLWQHVWRKCHSSSGSGSESGIRPRKSLKSKTVEGSDNNTGSNDEDDNTSIGLIIRDGSDNGSGTQSSWTKRAVEVDSQQTMSPWDQRADPPNSTCAQVIHSRPETFDNICMPTTAPRECRRKNDELDNLAMGKYLEIGVSPQISKLESESGGEKLEKDKLELSSGTPNGELTTEVADRTVAITNCSNTKMQGIEVPNDITKKNIRDKAIYDANDSPSLELSLKRLRDAREIGTTGQESNVLRHSDLSAFSRYNTATASQAPTGNVGSCSPNDNSSEAAKTESMQNLNSNSDGTPNRRSNGSSNNNDMGSTTNNAFTKPAAAFSDKPTSKSAVNIHPGSAFQPIQNSHVQVQHHHHHYHHHHHHVHNMKQQQQQQQQPNHEDLSLRTMVKADPHCGPSNGLSTPVEGNAANYSLNGSDSGSNNGSNGRNRISTDVINEEINMESDNGVVAGKSGAGGSGGSGSGSETRNRLDQNGFTPREAALNKFRQKRKERCFEKKVRYQSRKKLAEQRPRVRGQFVRQVTYENESKGKDS